MSSAVLEKPSSIQHSPLLLNQQLTLFDLAPLTIELPSKRKALRVKDKKKEGKNKRAKGKRVNVLRTQERKKELSLFPTSTQDYTYQHTEYLLYCLWDGLKKRNRDKFFASNVALSQYLSSEQFDVLLKECRWYFTLEDKAWLLSVMQGNRLKPLNLLFPCHHQVWGLINLIPRFPYPPVLTEVYPTFYLLLLMLALWENN